MDFEVGQRVRLIATEDCPDEEVGTVEEIEACGMLLVRVDGPLAPWDDGLREVSPEDVRTLGWKELGACPGCPGCPDCT